MELQLMTAKQPLQTRHELTAKHFAQNANGQKEAMPWRMDPAPAVWGETAGGNHAMDMRMMTSSRTIP
jgi:hypothetical protein